MRRAFLVLAAASWLVVGMVPSGEAADPSVEGSGVAAATFEGRLIDLRGGWGAARACLVLPGRPVECFRTLGEVKAAARGFDAPALACSSPLILYDYTYLGGASFSVYTRGLWINLSGTGFDNRTSSYRVGACAIDLASASNGGGSRYTRCLYAGCVENTMLSGWNNVVSSVYLH